jgi:hypothetical protein
LTAFSNRVPLRSNVLQPPPIWKSEEKNQYK